MTSAEQLALTVQASVLDRLALQLAAVEGALVRVEAAGREDDEAAAIERDRERAGLDRVERGELHEVAAREAAEEEGWTIVFEGPEPAMAAEPIGESARAPEPAPVDRWSAPMQPQRRERSPLSESKDSRVIEPMRVSESGGARVLEPMRASESGGARVLEPMRASESDPPEARESAHGLAGEREVDRWSRPLRPISASRREPPSIDPRAREASSRRSTALDRSPRLAAEPRSPIGPPIPEPSEPSEPLVLPVPLRLADDPGFDRSARVLEPSGDLLARTRPRKLGHGPSLARAAAEAREQTDSRSRELGLDDEQDELARLEERMADVLERVLMEIGVDP